MGTFLLAVTAENVISTVCIILGCVVVMAIAKMVYNFKKRKI